VQEEQKPVFQFWWKIVNKCDKKLKEESLHSLFIKFRLRRFDVTSNKMDPVVLNARNSLQHQVFECAKSRSFLAKKYVTLQQ